jgi:hypothetical protein
MLERSNTMHTPMNESVRAEMCVWRFVTFCVRAGEGGQNNGLLQRRGPYKSREKLEMNRGMTRVARIF